MQSFSIISCFFYLLTPTKHFFFNTLSIPPLLCLLSILQHFDYQVFSVIFCLPLSCPSLFFPSYFFLSPHFNSTTALLPAFLIIFLYVSTVSVSFFQVSSLYEFSFYCPFYKIFLIIICMHVFSFASLQYSLCYVFFSNLHLL